MLGFFNLSASAIVSEMICSTGLKASKGFTVFIPSALVVLGYGGAFYLLSLVLKSISLNTAYAVWAGLGTALIAVVGWFFLSELMSLVKAGGIALVIAGVVVINLAGGH
jgi:multidrug transporter EmrE-like cation transporter